MERHVTVVVKYDDTDAVPEFHVNMPLLGGVVTAVQFNDALSELEELTEQAIRRRS